jgi:hypothetical protein
MSRTQHKLKQAQSFFLMKLIEGEYARSGKSDAEFATYAAEQMGDPLLNRGHVQTARTSLEIPANGTAAQPACTLEQWRNAEARIRALEQEVSALTQAMTRFDHRLGMIEAGHVPAPNAASSAHLS